MVYDEAGDLLGEYPSAGTLIQETVLIDNTPVATLRPNGSSVTIYYVHADHLNAPRVVTQSSSDNSPTPPFIIEIVRVQHRNSSANQGSLGSERTG